MIAILAAGTFSRFRGIARQSLWSDEIYGIYLATGRGEQALDLPTGRLLDPPPQVGLAGAPSWPHVWTGLTAVPQPPLYHILLRWWMDLFGESDLATRGLSAALGLAGVLVLFDAVRRGSGLGAALAAAAVMALAVSQIDFSQEARSYTMTVLLGLLAIHAMVRIQRHGAGALRLAQLGLTVAASLLTHYFSAFALAGLGIYALLCLRGRDRVRTIGVMCIAAAAAAVLWGPWFWRQQQMIRADPANTSWQYDSNFSLPRLLAHAAATPALHLFDDSSRPLVIAAAVIVFVLPLILWRDRQRRLWLLWSVGAVGGLAAWDALRHTLLIDFARFTFAATPGFCFLAAAPLPLPRWRAWVLSGVMLAGVGIAAAARAGGPSAPHWPMAPLRGDLRQFFTLVDRVAAPREPLVFYEPTALTHLDYVAFAHYAGGSARPVMILSAPADAAALRELQQFPQVVVIYGPESMSAPPPILPGWRAVQSWGVSQTGAAVRMVRTTDQGKRKM
jgi:4-amino-4-deoxy-L-arabinose transferase-like glycosyltransferase